MAVPTEGREVEGGGSGRPGGLPWLLVKGDRLCSGVSSSFFFITINLLTIFLGKGEGSARRAHQQNGGAQCWRGTLSRCPRRR